MAAQGFLRDVDPDSIKPNPDNPRLVFREEDMNTLLDSIREQGIRVPVSLYEDGRRFVLLDGERRWRCARKLNLKAVPAIIQPKPSRLENILMMFNIHNVRVDWDPMAMALKLRTVRDLLQAEGRPTNAKALAAVTGVPTASVRRALDLLALPDRYQKMILKEAKKPRAEQRIKPDLFIEIQKASNAIERHMPELYKSVSRTRFLDAMVKKYSSGVVDNVVKFREVSRIARAENLGVDKKGALPALLRLAREPEYSIDDAYRDTVESAYERRDLLTRVRGITAGLRARAKRGRPIEGELGEALRELRKQIDRLIPR